MCKCGFVAKGHKFGSVRRSIQESLLGGKVRDSGIIILQYQKAEKTHLKMKIIIDHRETTNENKEKNQCGFMK